MSPQDTEKDLANLRKLSYFYYVSEGLNGLLLLAVLVFVLVARALMYLGAGSLFLAFLNRGIDGAAVTLLDRVQAGALLLPVAIMVGTFLGTLALAGLISGHFAGKYQREHKHHTFCMVMAGLTATSVPIGTAIGIPTFILLLRQPVKERFDRGDSASLEPVDEKRQAVLSRLLVLYGIASFVLSFASLTYLVSAFVLLTGDFDKAIVVRGSLIPWQFIASGLSMLIFGLALSVCTILAGKFLRERKAYVFCIVVSVFLTLFAPFGTILGVWSLFVLFSDPGRAAFRTSKPGGGGN